MVTKLLTDLQPSISIPRLQRYQASPNNDLDTITNYLWNIQLAESLFCSLNVLEIAFRNGLHATLTDHFGVPSWYDRPGLLEHRQVQEVSKVKDRITRNGKSVTPDRVVSELNFGFWVVVLSRPYDARLWQGHHAAPLKQVFMRIPKAQRQRPTIHARYNEIRELRNRVFHYEPLFDDPKLPHRHANIIQATHWLNPELIGVVNLQDRFPDTYKSGRDRIKSMLNGTLVGP